MVEKKNDCIKEKLDWERGVIRKQLDFEIEKAEKIGVDKDFSLKLQLLQRLMNTSQLIHKKDELIKEMAILQLFIRMTAETMGRTEQFEAEVTRILAECERDLEEGFR